MIETAPYVLDIGLVLLAAGFLGSLARRFGMPAVVGYLVVGLLVSPTTPGFVADSSQLSVLADIGVVLLLFEVGIEVDLARLSTAHRPLFWVVPLQVFGGMLGSAGVLYLMGFTPFAALLTGLGIAMSSSVVIVNITRSRRRTTNPHTDEALLGWAVLQDVLGVAAAAIVLAVFGAGEATAGEQLTGLVGYALFAYIGAKVLPRVLRYVRWEHDIFLIVSVSAGLTFAAIGAIYFHIPLALAAFVAGLSMNPRGDIGELRRVLLPFRDLFAVLFFVVIGSLIDLRYLGEAWPFALVLVALVIALKVLPAIALTHFVSTGARPLQLGIGLGQMGEFSFVLATIAVASGDLTRAHYVAVLMTVVITIIGSTTLVRWAVPRHQRV